MWRGLRHSVVLLLLLLASRGVDARARYQTLIPNGDSVTRNGAAWPAVGHQAQTQQRNAFGTAFAAAGYAWTSALCRADTDADGFSNGMELGDPNCTWTVGAMPARTTQISHPAYADSTPVNEATATPGGLLQPNAATVSAAPRCGLSGLGVIVALAVVVAATV